jgi:hypothetical protein
MAEVELTLCHHSERSTSMSEYGPPKARTTSPFDISMLTAHSTSGAQVTHADQFPTRQPDLFRIPARWETQNRCPIHD